jgi:DnaJ-class molecular chaperone
VKRFEEIDAARRLLGLPERATLGEIKAHYRRLVTEWHPDRSRKPVEECTEMTARIAAAYRTLVDYCSHYRYSFSKEEVGNHLSEQEWWFERFGKDPMWGK